MVDILDHDIAPFDGFARICRKCGCDDLHACPGRCYWVEDDLCSACVARRLAWSELNVSIHLSPFDWRVLWGREPETFALVLGPLTFSANWAWVKP